MHPLRLLFVVAVVGVPVGCGETTEPPPAPTLLAAEGGGNPALPAYNLYAIDAATGTARLLGPIGFGVTCMDFDPATGVLYGTTAPGSAGGARELITIDPATGAGTLVGPTNDGSGVNHRTPDCAFVGNVLYGTDGSGGNFISIDHTSGLVTVIGAAPVLPGGGFASDATSANTLYVTRSGTSIWTVDVGTPPFFTAGPNLVGTFGGRMNSATFHNGTLYAVEGDGPGGTRQLVTIDPATGVATPVGPLLPSAIDALASPTR